MEKSIKTQVFEILSSAKHIKTSEFSISKGFDFEIIEHNNEAKNSVLFKSLNEAVETLSLFAGHHRKEDITQQILKSISVDDLLIEPSFRVKFNLS